MIATYCKVISPNSTGSCGTNFNPDRNLRLSRFFSTSYPPIPRFAPASIYRTGVPSWDFDLEKSRLEHTPTPNQLGDGIFSAASGYAEVLAHSVIQRKAPSLAAASQHAG